MGLLSENAQHSHLHSSEFQFNFNAKFIRHLPFRRNIWKLLIHFISSILHIWKVSWLRRDWRWCIGVQDANSPIFLFVVHWLCNAVHLSEYKQTVYSQTSGQPSSWKHPAVSSCCGVASRRPSHSTWQCRPSRRSWTSSCPGDGNRSTLPTSTCCRCLDALLPSNYDGQRKRHWPAGNRMQRLMARCGNSSTSTTLRRPLLLKGWGQLLHLFSDIGDESTERQTEPVLIGSSFIEQSSQHFAPAPIIGVQINRPEIAPVVEPADAAGELVMTSL